LSRFPRSSLFYFLLVVVLGLVFWFTWNSIQNGQSASDWTFSTMMSQAASGQVKMVRGDAKPDWGPARRLNVVLAREIVAGKTVRVLAAPAVGTAVGADLCDFGFVAARERDLWLDADTIARTTWKMIEGTSIRPGRDGKFYRQETEALPYLREAAERLLAEKRGVFEALGI